MRDTRRVLKYTPRHFRIFIVACITLILSIELIARLAG